MIADTHQAALSQAVALQRYVEQLQAKIDALIEPICREVIATENVEEVRALLAFLPPGFHRMELRTYLFKLWRDHDHPTKFY